MVYKVYGVGPDNSWIPLEVHRESAPQGDGAPPDFLPISPTDSLLQGRPAEESSLSTLVGRRPAVQHFNASRRPSPPHRPYPEGGHRPHHQEPRVHSQSSAEGVFLTWHSLCCLLSCAALVVGVLMRVSYCRLKRRWKQVGRPSNPARTMAAAAAAVTTAEPAEVPPMIAEAPRSHQLVLPVRPDRPTVTRSFSEPRMAKPSSPSTMGRERQWSMDRSIEAFPPGPLHPSIAATSVATTTTTTTRGPTTTAPSSSWAGMTRCCRGRPSHSSAACTAAPPPRRDGPSASPAASPTRWPPAWANGWAPSPFWGGSRWSSSPAPT
mmetsp:Transcript_14404/g.22060  ORF Transcript_14404/g.22060 Transcript_14404/m.22060 type:complete len:322 (+) Transcript_14404:3-968(+)